MKPHWGATQGEWAAWRALSEPDLVPVVSNPDAEVSPDSTLVQKGKVPSLYNGRGKVVGVGRWTLSAATTAEVDRWSNATHGDYGVCLITRRFRAIDIDCEDPELVARIQAHLDGELEDLGMLGDATRTEHGFPVRVRSGSARRLLLAEVEGNLAKVIIRLPGEKQQIEILANGQQCIVAGTHTSGVRYEWPAGVPTREQIPCFTAEAWDGLVRRLSDAFGTGVSTVKSSLKVVDRDRMLPVDPSRDPVAHYLLTARSDMVVGREPGKIHVRCPWSAEHSDPELTGSATSWLVGGEAKGPDGTDEPPRFRCLHAHCADKGEGLFKLAIGALPFDDLTVVEDAVVAPDAPRSWVDVAMDLKARMLKHSTKEVGQNDVACCLNNVALLISTPEGTQLLGREFAWDTLQGAFVVRPWQPLEPDGTWSPLPVEAWRPIGENDQAHVRRVWDTLTKPGGSSAGGRGVVPGVWSERQLTQAITSAMVRDALQILADTERKDVEIPKRSFDSGMCRLHSLRWDGVRRIDTFWVDYAGVKDTPYARAVGRYTWTALAARVLKPGVQADMAVLLLGMQGARKTSFFQAMCLAEHWYATINLEDKEDDLIRLQRGKVIIEMEELRGLAGRDQQWTKAFLTRRVDEWVPKYEEHKRSYGRRHLYFGSGNEFHVLDDPTGERRYLPLASGATNTEALLLPIKCVDRETGEIFWSTLRDLLWAEGMATFLADGIAWEEAERLARGEHGKYKKINDHPWRTEFSRWIVAQLSEPWSPSHVLEQGITTRDFLQNVVPGKHKEHASDGKVVEKVMLVMGWTRTFRPGVVVGEPEIEVWMPPAGIFGGRKPAPSRDGHPHGYDDDLEALGRMDEGDPGGVGNTPSPPN